MSIALRRFRAYVRVVVVAVVFLAIGMVLFMNRNYRVSFWFFGLTDDTRPINVVYLILCTASGTVMSWRVGSMGWRLWRDLRAVRRERATALATKRSGQSKSQNVETSKRQDVKV